MGFSGRLDILFNVPFGKAGAGLGHPSEEVVEFSQYARFLGLNELLILLIWDEGGLRPASTGENIGNMILGDFVEGFPKAPLKIGHPDDFAHKILNTYLNTYLN
jgi:hypothetical protein